VIRHNVRTECWGFAVGSALFAVGSAPGFAAWAGAPAANVSFFIGSWFFTFAAFVQLQLSGSLRGPAAPIAGSERVGREVHKSEWWSSLVQFAGTIAFNISTGAALIVHSIEDVDRYSWRPDAYGSVAFLVSSGLAVFATELYRRRDEPDAPGWTATVLNTAGSIAFGFSAVGAYINPQSGTVVAPFIDQAGTFIGALCFLAASLVSLPRKSVGALAS
jgi:hypothetical protein